MLRRIGFVTIVALACSGLALAQGTSPVKVTGITVSPTSVQAGTNVTISVNLKNEGTAAYGCVGSEWMKAAVYIFKAQPYTVDNQIWQGSQALTANLAPGESKRVTLAAKWTVPNLDIPTFHIMAWSPVCAPDEFGQSAVLKLNKACVWRALPKFEFVKMPLKEIAVFKK